MCQRTLGETTIQTLLDLRITTVYYCPDRARMISIFNAGAEMINSLQASHSFEIGKLEKFFPPHASYLLFALTSASFLGTEIKVKKIKN